MGFVIMKKKKKKRMIGCNDDGSMQGKRADHKVSAVADSVL